MPEPGEPGGERGAHVPGTDDCDPHGVLLVLHEGRPPALVSAGGVKGRLADELGPGWEQVA
jgi:hypothetical protein